MEALKELIQTINEMIMLGINPAEVATADKKLLAVIKNHMEHSEKIQALYLVDGSSMLTACSNLGLELCQKFLLTNNIFNSFELNGKCKILVQACKNNHKDVVNLLFHKGVMLSKQSICSEDSCFYQATINGHVNILKQLIKFDHDTLCNKSVQKTLLLAACIGGHLEAVKFWSVFYKLPTSQQTSTSSECSSVTVNQNEMDPLYIACKEKHIKVVKYLAENGYTLTEMICHQFPEMIAETFLQEHIKREASEASITWKSIGLPLLKNNWFRDDLQNITYLNVSCNKLHTLPSTVPWGMKNLVALNVSHNYLDVFPSATDSIACQKVEEINLSHNHLKFLCCNIFELPHLQTLNVSNNQLVFVTANENEKSMYEDISWSCGNLQYLNLSHNTLQRFPLMLYHCTSLISLDFEHNQLIDTLLPWSCPLNSLNLSHNLLTELPNSLEHFWGTSLEYVNLNNNLFVEINESIIRIQSLLELQATNNRICSLPNSRLWSCHELKKLELGNNLLGQIDERSMERSLTVFRRRTSKGGPLPEEIDFPLFLSHCLIELHLENNHLDAVPPSVCHLTGLKLLNLSGNINITKLPTEIANLQSCNALLLDGLEIINLPKDFQRESNNRNIIDYFQERVRQSVPYRHMKIAVMGNEGDGKTALLECLMKKSGEHFQNSLGLNTYKWVLERPAKSLFSFDEIASITFNVWEFSQAKTFRPIHHSFITPNSLYLLVWDLRKKVENLKQWLQSIEAKAPRSYVIIVGTFLDQVLDKKCSYLKSVETKIGNYLKNSTYSLHVVKFMGVSSKTQTGIKELTAEIYNVASEMKDAKNNRTKLLDRKVPLSYISLAKKIQGIHQNLHIYMPALYIFEHRMMEIVESIDGNDIKTPDELHKVSLFLSDIGVIVYHVSNDSAMYFFNPSWLCDTLGKIFTDEEIQGFINNSCILHLKKADRVFKRIFKETSWCYIKLLERFEIAMKLKRDLLLIPSLLPTQSLGEYMDNEGQRVSHLYKMTYIPDNFWNYLIIRIMLSMERFSEKNAFISRKSSLLNNRQQSQRLYVLKNVHSIYRSDNAFARYSSGCFLIEVVYNEARQALGLLVTVASTEREFSMLGNIKLEIENVMNDFFPGLNQSEFIQSFALCPKCYIWDANMRDNILNTADHFYMEHCAFALATKTAVHCKNAGVIPNEEIIPDLMLIHIPKKFHIDSKIVRQSSYIASGTSGSVYAGKYCGVDVAIKYFGSSIKWKPSDKCSQTSKSESDKNVIDQEDFTLYSDSYFQGKAVLSNLQEMQHEVTLLSNLNHPCIISMFGFSISPMCMLMELAPLRSLRHVINSQLKKHKGETILFPKLLCYRILFQVARGLAYLHRKHIIYGDLKSDNILTWTLSLDADVNVKLSDYNFSQYTTPKGLKKMLGTPGYQAPEILQRYSYDNCVDIYSWSIVAYEILTGCRPFEKLNFVSEIAAAVIDNKRPMIKDHNLDAKFPCLEKMMTDCYNQDPSERPRASEIISKMTPLSFVAIQNLLVDLKLGVVDEILHITNNQGRSFFWLWEGIESKRVYHIIDSHTHSHLHSVSSAGFQVTCSTSIKNEVYIGTKSGEIGMIVNEMSNLRILPVFSISEIPVFMISNPKLKEIYIGTNTGILHIQRQELNPRKVQYWKEVEAIQLGTSTPITSMLLVTLPNYSELWVGCGTQINIISIDTKKIKCSFVSQVTDKASKIMDLKYYENNKEQRVFHYLEGLASILEYNACTYSLIAEYYVGIFTLGRRIVQQQQTSQKSLSKSLKMSMNLNFENEDKDNAHENPICCITSIAIIDNTLWVGRNLGDIGIINLDTTHPHFQKGEVLATISTDYLLPSTETPTAIQCITENDETSVFSLVQVLKNKNEETMTKVVFWEKYHLRELYQFQKHLAGIQGAEKAYSLPFKRSS
ncbi:leucine-rich repeat serine serine/threonine-protein kinase 1-like isoform X9 [Octopus vulgaris]|uniref:Leucine-rich repeat serine serine/threonine-protein kinase 1-like isoform X9 n=1 Tax=Octopus vulgaris TaxID=6645 RepID=A0AA36FB70_OCTVU|nr:leucine-rich repeat serine serine/threonine-protein kinase 1-like isoform X9 [Octopus vulgaris]